MGVRPKMRSEQEEMQRREDDDDDDDGSNVIQKATATLASYVAT